MVNLTKVEPSYDESLKAPIKNHRIEWDDIDRKLIERPSFSFRLQLILGFLLLFFLSMATLIGSMAGIRQIQNKLRFVLATERFLFEIEQARRWEKNYFLYGTNLTEAAESASNAKILLSQNLKSYQKIAQQQAEEIVKNLDGYQNLLNDLSLFDRESPSGGPAKKHEIEIELRKKGSAMIEIAASLARKEEDSMNDLLNLIQRIPIYALAVYLLLLTYIIYFLSQRFMKRLNSLVNSTQRIASGGFSPIIPIHKTRDEFTTVSIAINKMLEELDSRQTAMVESHKLKAIGTLTAGVAHELNNPINNIMLTAYSMLEEYEELSKKDMLEMINDLIKEADRSRSIVRNLLEFARESESVSELLNLGELVEETLKLASNQIRVSDVKVDISVQPNLAQIRGDKQKLKQVFLNIILNAADAVQKKHGEIKIDVEQADSRGFLAVHIRDNGCGIADHILPYIFDPFFTAKKPGKGSGLGLSVSHGIVNIHGGKIHVESEEGKYTRFTVLLPTVDMPADISRA